MTEIRLISCSINKSLFQKFSNRILGDMRLQSEVVNRLHLEHERMYSSAFRSDEEATEGSN